MKILCLLCGGAFIAVFAQTPIRVDVDLVRVPCIVTDDNGALVTNLKREEFSVVENGAPQEVKYLWRDLDMPLAVGLVGDVSSSQSGFVAKHKQTLTQFLSNVLTNEDRAFVVAVARQQRLAADLTASVDRLQEGIQRIRAEDNPVLGEPCEGRSMEVQQHKTHAPPGWPCGGTVLWNAVYYSAKSKLKQEPWRKALLILTDGFDTGSDHSLTDAIEACQSADTVVYGILYSESPYRAALFSTLAAPLTIAILRSRNAKGKRDVNRITLETGGASFDGSHMPLKDIFARIERELREQYVLGFTPSTRSPGVHRITVAVTRPGLHVRARKWYSQ